nr:formylglycine-generating enzyme family protein [uncultured Desulfobulbus sp.]
MTQIMPSQYTDPTTGICFVSIPQGTFIMGSPREEKNRKACEGPQHIVHISAFHLAQFQVTQEQYSIIMGVNPSDLLGANCPVDCVSWEDAQAFISTLNAVSQATYRLPTEAEWEYSCRASTQTPFYFGQTITPDQVNYGSKTSCRNTPMGIHPPNGFGLYDMHGNVYEWCEDTWHDSYQGAPSDGSAWVDESTNHKVYRGGAWNTSAHFARSAYRFHQPQTWAYYNIGFRLAF